MIFLESIILGLVQGLTEFLPISSSGHLILVRKFLNISLIGSLAFDVFLNTATLLAVIYCFWGDIRNLGRDFLTEGFSSRSKKMIWALILGTIPAGFFGFFYSRQIEEIFRSEWTVAVALVVGSTIMFLADKIKASGGISATKGLVIGFFQALALIPGISRSGSSISGGILAGLSREEAIRFSFLLLIPTSLGALLKIILDIFQNSFSTSWSQFLTLHSWVAFLVALTTGVWTIRFLVRYLSTNSFMPFIIYRLLIAAIILLFI